MFARRINVKYEVDGQWRMCPMKWLDNFAMRSFTNDSLFDDTLPIGDGMMEVGTRVPLEELRAAMQDWFQRKGYLEKTAKLALEEQAK